MYIKLFQEGCGTEKDVEICEIRFEKLGYEEIGILADNGVMLEEDLDKHQWDWKKAE